MKKQCSTAVFGKATKSTWLWQGCHEFCNVAPGPTKPIPHGSTQPRVVPLLSFIERIEVSTGKDVVAMAGSPPDNKQKDKLKNAQEHCFGFKALGSGGITREGYSPLGPGTRNRSCKEWLKFSWKTRPKPTGTKIHCVNFNFIVFFSSISEKLAEYNLGEEIGQGGFGCVFSGTRKFDNLPVSNSWTTYSGFVGIQQR